MESAGLAPPSTLGRTFAKILRLRRGPGSPGVCVVPDEDVSVHNLKKSANLDGYSPLGDDKGGEDEQRRRKQREAMESLLANLFACISAVKAAYAQLQAAQAPYEPETIQSADQAVVSELRRISELKQCYLKRQIPDARPALAAQIQEQRNILKTYKITTRKLESDFRQRDSELCSLRAQLLESEKQNRALEARLHPDRSLSAVDDLRLSDLNATHFLAVLRHAVKSVHSFVKQMLKEMESAGWDLDAAAASVHPGARSHRSFAFESYVCQMMFSDFQHRDFSLGSLEDLSGWDRHRFFDEFTAVNSPSARQILDQPGAEQTPLGKFLRVKYLLLVHPKMEAAFFGGLEQRELMSSGRGFPSSGFFAGFAEMGRRVWMLHCLFFSFQTGEEAAIIQVRRGCRFSEVYMESVVAEDEGEAAKSTVGFTVVPGFRVGRTIIQCKVYLSSSSSDGALRGRS